jgi:hypothetical protein
LKPLMSLNGNASSREPGRVSRDQRFDAEASMLGTFLRSRSYHSSLEPGQWVCETRGSLDYALTLLREGDPKATNRARAIVDRVLSLQDTDPCSATYGIWPYYLEEPLSQMSPPDWNWADFCGAMLADMLAEHAGELGEPLVAAMKQALGHAAWSIFRRNVGPDYTNIAVMGGVVTAAAGERLDEPRLLEYGRRRLQRLLAYTRKRGGFTEYNSPTYSLVTLRETERALRLIHDADCRDAAEALRRLIWEMLAAYFHPPTQQLAGPHARAYDDRLSSGAIASLNSRLGGDLLARPAKPGRASLRDRDTAPPCPPELRPAFESLQLPERVETRVLVDDPNHGRVVGTTWMNQQATLGSASDSELWAQRRPLLGYWVTGDEPVVAFRVRLLRDGTDFARGRLRCAQKGRRVSGLVTTRDRGGDFHLHLDAPADGWFDIADLRLRFQLTGRGVRATAIDPGRFVLAAGAWRAVIHPAEGPATIADRTPRWTLGQEGDAAFVDAVFWSGEPRRVTFNDVSRDRLAFGVELLQADERPTGDRPHLTPREGDGHTLTWLDDELRLDV